MARIPLAISGTDPGRDPRTDHLRPVIVFLPARGNRPAYWWYEDGWRADRDGLGKRDSSSPTTAANFRLPTR